MTDTPADEIPAVYRERFNAELAAAQAHAVAHPLTAVTSSGVIFIDNTVLVAQLPPAAVSAIQQVIATHNDEFRAALAPLGVDWYTVPSPNWERLVSPTELIALLKATPVPASAPRS